jgi:hypothetical protein
MPILAGNTSGSIQSVAYKNPCKIVSFTLVNKSGGSISVNVFIDTGQAVHVIPMNSLVQISGAYIYSGEPIYLLANHSIAVLTTGAVDYYFTLESM